MLAGAEKLKLIYNWKLRGVVAYRDGVVVVVDSWERVGAPPGILTQIGRAHV